MHDSDDTDELLAHVDGDDEAKRVSYDQTDETKYPEEAGVAFDAAGGRPHSNSKKSSTRFFVAATINSLATVGIVFTNKSLFSDAYFRHAQLTFATCHLALTATFLYVLSRPRIGVFQAKRASLAQIAPMAVGMILNVVLPNLSLAHSSVTFYQITRVLLTPCTALINYVVAGTVVPGQAALALLPVCIGVAVVSYFETFAAPVAETPQVQKTWQLGTHTSMLGVVFSFAGVLVGAAYGVAVDRYHDILKLNSWQLLFNQAPVSVLMLSCLVPFVDEMAIWKHDMGPAWLLVALSGIFACAINVTQFIIINEAGPVSGTVVGHFKGCLVVVVGWIVTSRGVGDGSIAGIVLAFAGVIW